MQIVQWDNGSKSWEERDLAHGVITELSISGAILRTIENHESMFQVDPNDEEIDCAAIASDKYIEYDYL